MTADWITPKALTPLQLARAWRRGRIVPLAAPSALEQAALAAAIGPAGLAPLERQWGPGVVLGSGGSHGGHPGGDCAGRRWCLLPLADPAGLGRRHGPMAEALGLDPAVCLHLNPLPLRHVSGLLPWLRARQWGARHRRWQPAWLRQPTLLPEVAPLSAQRPVLLSLVHLTVAAGA